LAQKGLQKRKTPAAGPGEWFFLKKGDIIPVRQLASGRKKMNPQTKEWLGQSDYDLKTAQAMFRTGRYIYTVYMCHLALEKALKAVVAETTGSPPPKTHNLISLVKAGAPAITKEQVEFLAELNTANIAARYPDELKSALKKYTRKVASEYLKKTKDVVKCLKKGLRKSRKSSAASKKP
jgi:HEPN domain-containing protein